MLSKILRIALRFAGRLGVRVVLMAALAVVAALFAPNLEGLIPEELQQRFGAEAVLPILEILAASLLTVTTFSLGVMVSAFQSASSEGSPRAYRVLMRDTTTQTVLATFVSGFLFSLTALVMFNAGFYGDGAAVVVFALTIVTIVLIVVAILRWIDLLSQLGSMDHTLWQVEDAAQKSLRTERETLNYGANRSREMAPPPPAAIAVVADRTGYLQFIDLPRLNTLLCDREAALWMAVAPGKYVLKNRTICHVSPGTGDLADEICQYMNFGRERTMEQDPRFGLIVLSEIACRALSPGTNDPGTAIDVIHRLKKLLWEHATAGDAPGQDRDDPDDDPDDDPVLYPRVHLPAATPADLVEDAYSVIIRDAAGRIEVIGQIIEALDDLSNAPGGLGGAARRLRSYARDHAAAEIGNEDDLATLARL